MKVEIDTRNCTDSVTPSSVIKLFPENNREMRDLEFLHEKYGPPYYEKCITDDAICYLVQFTENLRGLK